MSVYDAAREHLRIVNDTLLTAVSEEPSRRAKTYLVAVKTDVENAIGGEDYQLLEFLRYLKQNAEDMDFVLLAYNVNRNMLATVRNQLAACYSFIEIIEREREARDEEESDDEDESDNEDESYNEDALSPTLAPRPGEMMWPGF
jgi:hypothetical protein